MSDLDIYGVSATQLITAIEQMQPINAEPTHAWFGEAFGDLVYFIACRNYVKIGYSANVERRAQILQRMIPFQISVLGVVPGGRSEERQIHKALAKRRHHNEWFHMNDTLERVIILETAQFRFTCSYLVEAQSRSERYAAEIRAMQFLPTLSPTQSNVVPLKKRK